MGTKSAADAGTDLATIDNSALAYRACSGKDPEAAIELARRLKDDPKEMIRLCHGDLAHVVEDIIVTTMIHADQPIMQQAVRLRIAEIRRGLKGPNPSTLERLLIDRCVLTWVDLYTMETQFRNNDYNGKSFKYIEAMSKRLDMAERRHLRALKTLADVRRLNLTADNIHLRSLSDAELIRQARAALAEGPTIPARLTADVDIPANNTTLGHPIHEAPEGQVCLAEAIS